MHGGREPRRRAGREPASVAKLAGRSRWSRAGAAAQEKGSRAGFSILLSRLEAIGEDQRGSPVQVGPRRLAQWWQRDLSARTVQRLAKVAVLSMLRHEPRVVPPVVHEVEGPGHRDVVEPLSGRILGFFLTGIIVLLRQKSCHEEVLPLLFGS